MDKIKALVTLGLITEKDVIEYVKDLEYQEMIRIHQEEQLTQADYEMDNAHNEVLPF